MFTLGTAGHIDHGKTTLCLHLTGVDTDRLRDEKSRGISIDLGFAEVKTPLGHRLGLIDVPGHERFIRNMVAGVCGMDGVIFVVAADEGVMPQSREHFDIIRLLGVEDGVTVLTKCDMAEDELIDIVEEDLRDFLKGTALEESPIIRTRSDKPESYAKVANALDGLLARLKPRLQSGHFRLPIDRAFSLRGHGTVVTGTVASGTIRRGDKVIVLPEGIPSRIRSIQSFGESSDAVVGGQRAALNLADLPLAAIGRGSCVCPPDVFEAAHMIDGRFRMLDKLPKGFSLLEHASRIRFYVGTSEVIGRIHLLDCKQVKQGGEAMVQFRLESPVVAARGDPFLVRTFSPLYTIGGGEVLNASAKKHRNRAKAASELERIASKDPFDIVLSLLEEDPRILLSLDELAKAMALPPEELSPHLPPNTENAGVLLFETVKGELYCSERRILAERLRLLRLIDEYHEREASSPGMARASLQQAFSARIETEVFNLLLSQLLDSGDVESKGKVLLRRGFKAKLDEELERTLELMGKALKSKSDPLWTVSLLKDYCSAKQKTVERAIGLLLHNEDLSKLPQGNFALSDRVKELKRQVISFLEEKGGEADTNEIKKRLGLSRKHAIPLLEHLDESGITLRIGNSRRLRSG